MEIKKHFSTDELVAELWARDVCFISRSFTHAVRLSPGQLITALAESNESRLQLSLIPLFLRHPEFSKELMDVIKNTDPRTQLLLKFFYSAAVWLERKYLSKNELQDLFSQELGYIPKDDAEENLALLAKRQQELCNPRINWLGTYEHAANIWIKEIDLQKT